MNTSWIVALLRPRDLLMGRPMEDEQAPPATQLAALVLGEALYARKFSISDISDDGIKAVSRSLDPSNIRQGLAGLVSEVVENPSEDMARTCALGLMACCAAAEIEDYATCELVLDSLLNNLEVERSAVSHLLRALAFQQKSLRIWDTGGDHKFASTQALKAIDQVKVEELPNCELGPYANPRNTFTQIVDSLRNAIWSLSPMRGMMNGWEEFPSRKDILKAPRPEQLTKIKADRADAYSSFVQQTFRNRFGNRTRYILGGPTVPDTFAQSLALELFGHASVREARKELALLRLVQIDAFEQTEHVRDALRLLRHSRADRDLSTVVERFRMAGPLWALSEDARQIIQQRTGAYPPGRPEMRVLRGAAELMTVSEANRALMAIRECHDDSSIEDAWRTSARLANPAQQSSEVAEYLLRQAKSREESADRLDGALARAVQALNWDTVRPEVTAMWSAWLKSRGLRWPATAETAITSFGLEFDDSESLQDLDSVAVQLNSADRGNAMPPAVVRRSVELVTSALRDLITEARGQSYSMKFPAAADVAAALIVHSGADLWQDLALCLTEPRMHRNETDRAFERLAHERPPITDAAERILRKSTSSVLFSQGGFFEAESDITPYPEALRFLAVYGMIDDSILFSHIAKLAGSDSARSREQAARTVSTIAEVRHDTWIQAIASQLSHDHDVSVRSHAGRALALFSDSDELSRRMIRDRIIQLLGEDGVATPIRTLSSLKSKSSIDADILSKVQQLVSDHPSIDVRRVAKEVVESCI
ncbi:hypothetical protein ACIG0A_14410 [Streptomyces californicus]|uniref:hypothetical protein n=1 Tax=Streptomyces californicus TaxID=67351 RepID=UPI0037D0FF41